MSEAPLPDASGSQRRRWIALAIGVTIGALAGLGIGRLLPSGAGGGDGAKEPELWTTTLLDSADLSDSGIRHFWLTRDGRSLVMEKIEDGEPRFYRRPLESLQTLPVALGPGQRPGVHSPDGRLLAIEDAHRTLRTMPTEGGEPGSALAEGVNFVGTWGEDGYIYYQGEPAESAGHSAFESLITWRVRAAGGEPKPLGPGFPTDLLPGERIVLTTVVRHNPPDYWGTVMAVDVATGASRFLVTGNNARYLDPGFLVFCRNRALWAAPIDSATGELSAPARSIEDVAATDAFYDFCRFDVSRSGNLVYEARREVGLGRLVWVARDGTVEPVAEEVKAFTVPIPSLDGRQVSVSVEVPGAGLEQWILDLSSGAWSRPAQSGPTGAMSWVPPDGRDVVFISDPGGGRGQVFLQPADHSAPAERLWPSEQPQAYLDISSDGQQAILMASGTQGFVVLDRRSGKVRAVIEDGTVYAADFHPDSDWIVYARIDAKGTSNLWLVPFPGPGEPRQVTFDGGEDPRWSIAADEIYYRGPTHVMALAVEKSGAALAMGRPQTLFEDHFRHHILRGILNYMPHPNGRLLMIEKVESKPSLVLVLNWRAKVAQAFAPGGDG